MINLTKLESYMQNGMILEFNSELECLEYFNTYDFQNFKTVEEMKRHQGVYGFGYAGKWYHIDQEKALDVLTMDKYTRGALLEAERRGVTEYTVKGNYMVWYVNYKEYHSKTCCKRNYKGETYRVTVNLDTKEETRTLLKNFLNKGYYNPGT